MRPCVRAHVTFPLWERSWSYVKPTHTFVKRILNILNILFVASYQTDVCN